MTTSELDRLRDAYPPLQTPVPQATHARLDALIAEAAARVGPDDATGPAPTQRPRRARPLVLAGGAVALALVAVVAVALAPGGSRTPSPEAASARAACTPRGTASRCAHALSRVALGYALPGTGDVTYVRSSWVAMGFTVDDQPDGPGNHIELPAAKQPFEVVRPATEEYWVAPDGRGRFAQTDPGAARLASTADEIAWRAAGAPDLEALLPPPGEGVRPLEQDVPHVNAVLLGANGLYDFLPHNGDPLAPIPRAPAELAAWLRERAWKERATRDQGCRPDGDGCEAVTRREIDKTVAGDIATLLAYPDTPRRLAAALVQVLGEQPGARALGLLRDEAGREVAAIGLPAGTTDMPDRGVIALDPETGVLRAVGSERSGAIRWARTYAVTAARVTTLGARP
jgi:hypothetical protein